MNIEIDPASGFCFGVVKAVDAAEAELKNNNTLYCLGDIVHNNMEIERLRKKGLITISHNELSSTNNKRILIRAHGEPPTTYTQAKEKGHTIVDATCPVVLNLQTQIRKSWQHLAKENGQLIIFGKTGHAEVVGLVGQTNNQAIVVGSIDELANIDMNKPTHVYAQTTQGIDEYKEICEYIKTNINPNVEFKSFDTICRQVSGRLPKLMNFAQKHDIVVFVGGKKSSNAKILYAKCKQANSNSFFVSNTDDLQAEWFNTDIKSVGISGATSTPPWLMEEIANAIKSINTTSNDKH